MMEARVYTIHDAFVPRLRDGTLCFPVLDLPSGFHWLPGTQQTGPWFRMSEPDVLAVVWRADAVRFTEPIDTDYAVIRRGDPGVTWTNLTHNQ